MRVITSRSGLCQSMRPCPICSNGERRELESGYAGRDVNLYSCSACGFRYVDADYLDQAWLDSYYKTFYTTDDKQYSYDRYESLAIYLKSITNDVLDIGGLDGELGEHCAGQGIAYEAIGVGDAPRDKYDCVVVSHTLEHIYDIHTFMQRVKSALVSGGWLVVEVPHFRQYAGVKGYDYHWQHINKFRTRDLMALFRDNGFSVEYSQSAGHYREYQCWRISGKMN